MGQFWRGREGIEGWFGEVEVELLRRLTGELVELLAPPPPAAGIDPLEELVGLAGGPTAAPTDPALARLLPDGYRQDDGAAAEFRRFTEPELRAGKVAAARAVAASLHRPDGHVLFDPETADAWLVAVNDLRLTLAVRLDIVAEEQEPPPPGDPRRYSFGVYLWLSRVLDRLVEVLERG